MDYHMQFMEFLSLLQKRGLSYVIYGISFSSSKMLTIICYFWNFFLFKNMDYHRQFLEFLSLLQNVDYHMQFLEFLSLLHKSELSHVSFKIPFPYPKMWTIICSLWNLFPFSINVDYRMQVSRISFPSS